MKLECPQCHRVFDIPDERLNFDRDVVFPCPACKGKIEIRVKRDQPEPPAEPQAAEPAQPEPKAAAPRPAPPTKAGPTGDVLKTRIMRTILDLPPMPQVVQKAREIMGNPNANFQALANVFETDQAIAARVLKLANSAYYGVSGKVASVQHAAVVLGQKTLAELLAMAGTTSLLSQTLQGYGLAAGDLWAHALAVAQGAKIIAGKRDRGMADDAFTAGLIHDAGKLILDKYITEREQEFQALLSDGRHMWLDAEKQLLGFDHAEIAADVCQKWRVPDELAVAIRYHHEPGKSGENRLAHIVHVADAIAMMSGLGTGIDGMLYRMDETALPFLSLQEEDVSTIMGEVIDYVERTTRPSGAK
ncbi:MAG: HDOD domain-containing protein [Kiritimatiellae bacterium]|nr:HDOD domain-containing protein [Kiritimatiellia bacterium]